MKTIEMTARSGADRVIRLNVPADRADENYRIVVVLESESPVSAASAGWPEGFFDRYCGRWVGELAREPQGEYEVRQDF